MFIDLRFDFEAPDNVELPDTLSRSNGLADLEIKIGQLPGYGRLQWRWRHV
jgi:hypothetical protein